MTPDERRARAAERKAALEVRRRDLRLARELRLRVEAVVLERRFEASRVRAEAMVARRTPEQRLTYERMSQWARQHPERRRAHRQVHSAIRSGKITRPERCDGCGLDRRLEAHHGDYTKPLGVRWFCRSCRLKEHREAASSPAP